MNSPPGQTAAVEATVAELVDAAAELEAADAVVDVGSVAVDADVDAVGADWAARVHTVVASRTSAAAASPCPSAVNGGLGGGDGCVGAAVGGNVGVEALGLTQLSED